MSELDNNGIKRDGIGDMRISTLDDIAASIDSVDIRDDFMFSYVMWQPRYLHKTPAISIARP